MIALLIALTPLQSFAGFTDSFWFEPTLLCVAGGAGGYLGAPDGDEVLYGAVGCAVGAGIGYLINSHYKNKFTTAQQKELDDKLRTIQEMQAQQAQRAARGEDESIAVRIQEIVPGQTLPDGSVMAPTLKERLVLPGEGIRVGE